jgi:hypothetical protein
MDLRKFFEDPSRFNNESEKLFEDPSRSNNESERPFEDPSRSNNGSEKLFEDPSRSFLWIREPIFEILNTFFYELSCL